MPLLCQYHVLFTASARGNPTVSTSTLQDQMPVCATMTACVDPRIGGDGDGRRCGEPVAGSWSGWSPWQVRVATRSATTPSSSSVRTWTGYSRWQRPCRRRILGGRRCVVAGWRLRVGDREGAHENRCDLGLDVVDVPFGSIVSGDLGEADMAIAQITITEERSANHRLLDLLLRHRSRRPRFHGRRRPDRSEDGTRADVGGHRRDDRGVVRTRGDSPPPRPPRGR